MPLALGDRFTVSAPYEVKDKRGKRLANYLPGFDYRVTPRNIAIVTEMIAAGKATVGTAADAARANQLAAKSSTVTGAVKTTPPA